MTAPTATGYMHPAYAESFAEFATPRELPSCGGSVLERPIPDSDMRDAMGCYPIFCCRNWDRLPSDFAELSEIISLTLVTDPFGDVDIERLRRCFDVVRPYKQHFVADLTRSIEDRLPRRHRRNLARGQDRISLETVGEPGRFLDDWIRLFAVLTRRHRIAGLRAFSRRAFARQLVVPGIVMFRAAADGQTIGLHLWYVQGEVAYGHLGATNELGYELMASYALYRYAIEELRGRVSWLDLGAGAGAERGAGAGLRDFKRGWSTGVRETFLCGRVFKAGPYASLTEKKGVAGSSYFPAYRSGEFSTAAEERP